MSEDLVQISEASARGSFFLVTGQIAALVVQAVAVFVVARLLGPDLYGMYALSLVFPSLLLIIVDLGINQAIIRFSANLRLRGRNQQIARLIRDGLIFKLIIGLIVFGICFIYSEYLATYPRETRHQCLHSFHLNIDNYSSNHHHIFLSLCRVRPDGI